MIQAMTTRLHPGPYASRRLKNRPQCLSVKGGQEWKGKDRESKRGFLGVSFQPSPWSSRTSVGVEDKDRDKSEPNGVVISMVLGTPPRGKGAGSSLNGARVAWLHYSKTDGECF